jgi:hypothetical protein
LTARQRVRRWAQVSALGGFFASALAVAAPSAAALARCAAIAEPGARLACYDALSGVKSDSKTAAASPAAVAAPTPAAGASAPAPAPAPAAASSFASDPQNFGLTEAQRAPASLQAGPKSIEAHVTKMNETRQGSASAVLDNGQIWVFVDGEQEADVRPQDLITIKRGALGSFVLVTRSHHSYHVRRIQ